LLATGQSPFDPVASTRLQHELGWDKDAQGGGRYDFLPYYCPPWLALFCAPLSLIDHQSAETVWFYINLNSLILASILLKKVLGYPAGISPPFVLFTFFPTYVALWAGQTTAVILLAVAVAWWLIEHRWDGWAGALLACLTVKPQVSSLLLLGLMAWAARQRRWRVVFGFGAGLGVLCLVSTALQPSWPAELLRATRVTPLPTDHWPWVGASWTLALRTLGVRGQALWLTYAAAAVPVTVLALVTAWDIHRPIREVFALGCLGAFFIAPYSQLYDYPILTIPLLVLSGHRMRRSEGRALVAAFLVLPFAHALLLSYALRHHVYSNYIDKYLLIIIPIGLTVSWLLTGSAVSSGLASGVTEGRRSILHVAVASRKGA
jgi:hypothetical protein